MIVVLSAFRPYAAARYVFPSIPAFFLLVAGLIERLGSTKRVALASLIVAPLLLVDHRHVTEIGIEDWPGLTACIAANAQPGDRLATAKEHRPGLDYYWSDHPELAKVEPLSPPEPLGVVRRLYESRIETPGALHATLFEDTTESIWFVERGAAGRLGLVGLAFDRQLTDHYELTDTWYFRGGLSMVRLDPIGLDRPRPEARCDTVETPDDMKPKL
jgi:hypothetical protein